jgi:UDP-N-acetylmuramoyl-tripeptide--D-alanyl-D-alanine ligase
VRGAAESGTEAVFVANPEEAGAWVKANVVADDAVLFKASRGVRLERALAALEDA